MPVLCVASSKGGPGKTTVAQLVAGALSAEGVRVCVIDADPSAAFSRWASGTREGPPLEVVHEVNEERLAHTVHEKAGEFDLVVIDTAGFGSRSAAIAITSSDAVLVPAQAGEADVTEAERTIRLVEGIQRAARRPIPARVVFNRVKNTLLARHAAEEVNRAGLPRLRTELGDLVGFGSISYSGQIPTGGPAGRLVERLVQELRELGFVPAAPAETAA